MQAFHSVGLLASGRQRFFVAMALAIACATPALAQVQGAGSTLARELMAAWSAQHGAAVGGVTYEAVGSCRGEPGY